MTRGNGKRGIMNRGRIISIASICTVIAVGLAIVLASLGGRAAAAQCTVCHGASGKGDPSKGVPDLTGQPPGYLRNQMLLFKADRRSPGDEQLKAVKALMRTIPDEQFSDLAAYWSSLR